MLGPVAILAAEATAAPSATTIFYLTLLFIFLTAIITTVVTKWSRDKCLKLLDGYRVTLERTRGQTLWGSLKVFSSGVEVVYDHPFVDVHGREKTSFMIYAQEMDQQVHALVRFHGELDETARRTRLRQVRRGFNPGPVRRLWRGFRNFVNTLRDAFNAAIGAAVAQVQRTSPAGAVLATQGTAVTSMGQTILGKFAGNAYEPLLEQYIGRPVILDVADPLNPNNAAVEYAGFLVDYTQQFIAVMNVEHGSGEEFTLALPDAERGERLPPLPPPPPPGAPAPVLPPPLKVEQELEVRLDGARFKVRNVRHEPVAVQRLERAGFEPLALRAVLPPGGILDLPARDARGGTLVCTVVRCLDVVVPRRLATVRHAGRLLAPTGLAAEMQLDRLPLVSKLFGESTEK